MISGVYQCYVFKTSDKNNIGIKCSFQAPYLPRPLFTKDIAFYNQLGIFNDSASN